MRSWWVVGRDEEWGKLSEDKRAIGSREEDPHPSPLPAYRERGQEAYRERGQEAYRERGQGAYRERGKEGRDVGERRWLGAGVLGVGGAGWLTSGGGVVQAHNA